MCTYSHVGLLRCVEPIGEQIVFNYARCHFVVVEQSDFHFICGPIALRYFEMNLHSFQKQYRKVFFFCKLFSTIRDHPSTIILS